MDDDVKCPSCGLVIKVTVPEFKFCPVCGASLPELSPSQKMANKNVPKMISLEQALSSKARSGTSWSFRELLNFFGITIFATLTIRFIAISFWLQGGQGGEMAFDPAFVIVTYLSGMVAGIFPILYLFRFKLSGVKIGWKKLVPKQWGEAVVLGAICGVGLYLFQLICDAFNAAIYQATAWSLFSQGGTFQSGYDAFMASNFPWNKLSIIVVLGIQLVIMELFFRGTVVNGALQYRQDRREQKRRALARVEAIAISIGLNTLFSFLVSIFDITAIIFDILANSILALLFIRAKNVQSCMIAQVVYVILLLIF